jgi:plastocyanin
VAEGGDTASRIAWAVLVPFCIVLALIAVVVIVRENTSSAADTVSAVAASNSDEAPPTVVMEKLAFSPATLTVRRGAEVLFENKDVAPHTVTADEGARDSGIIDPGSAFGLVVEEPFAYHCAIHPSMTAKIELEG